MSESQLSRQSSPCPRPASLVLRKRLMDAVAPATEHISWRHDDGLADGEVVVGVGDQRKIFRVHCVVLAAVSQFFYAQFSRFTLARAGHRKVDLTHVLPEECWCVLDTALDVLYSSFLTDAHRPIILEQHDAGREGNASPPTTTGERFPTLALAHRAQASTSSSPPLSSSPSALPPSSVTRWTETITGDALTVMRDVTNLPCDKAVLMLRTGHVLQARALASAAMPSLERVLTRGTANEQLKVLALALELGGLEELCSEARRAVASQFDHAESDDLASFPTSEILRILAHDDLHASAVRVCDLLAMAISRPDEHEDVPGPKMIAAEVERVEGLMFGKSDACHVQIDKQNGVHADYDLITSRQATAPTTSTDPDTSDEPRQSIRTRSKRRRQEKRALTESTQEGSGASASAHTESGVDTDDAAGVAASASAGVDTDVMTDIEVTTEGAEEPLQQLQNPSVRMYRWRSWQNDTRQFLVPKSLGNPKIAIKDDFVHRIIDIGNRDLAALLDFTPGDVILAVNDVPTYDKTCTQVNQLIEEAGNAVNFYLTVSQKHWADHAIGHGLMMRWFETRARFSPISTFGYVTDIQDPCRLLGLLFRAQRLRMPLDERVPAAIRNFLNAFAARHAGATARVRAFSRARKESEQRVSLLTQPKEAVGLGGSVEKGKQCSPSSDSALVWAGNNVMDLPLHLSLRMAEAALPAERWAERRQCLSRDNAVVLSMQLLALGKEVPQLNRDAMELKAEVLKLLRTGAQFCHAWVRAPPGHEWFSNANANRFCYVHGQENLSRSKSYALHDAMKAFTAARYPNSFSGRMWVGARPNAETARCAMEVLMEAGEQTNTMVEGWTPLMLYHKHMESRLGQGARFIEEVEKEPKPAELVNVTMQSWEEDRKLEVKLMKEVVRRGMEIGDVKLEGKPANTHKAQFMGIYECRKDVVVHGRPVFQMEGKANRYLYYFAGRAAPTPDSSVPPHWAIGNEKSMKQAKGAGWWRSSDAAFTPDQIASRGTPWKVFENDQNAFVEVPGVRLRLLPKAEKDKIMAERSAQKAKVLKHAASVGNIVLNHPSGLLPAETAKMDYMGEYAPVEDVISSARPVYCKKINDNMHYMFYHERRHTAGEGYWTIGTEHHLNKGKGNGWWRSHSDAKFAEEITQPWKVWNVNEKKYCDVAGVIVRRRDEAPQAMLTVTAHSKKRKVPAGNGVVYTITQARKMRKNDIKVELAARGLNGDGLKEQLAQRLVASSAVAVQSTTKKAKKSGAS